MLVALLWGCGGSSQPVEDPAVTPKTVVVAPAEPEEAPRRPAVVEAERVTGWGTDVPACSGCVPLKPRVQASSERVGPERSDVAELAMDGDLHTAWCAGAGGPQKLAFAWGTPRTVRQIVVAGWDGQGGAVHEVVVVTDGGDRIPLAIDAPNGEWPGLGDQPPAIDVVLQDIQILQLEIRSVHGAAPVCVAEVQVLGEP